MLVMHVFYITNYLRTDPYEQARTERERERERERKRERETRQAGRLSAADWVVQDDITSITK